MKTVTIKNALIVTPDEVKKQDLLIKDGKIAENIANPSKLPVSELHL